MDGLVKIAAKNVIVLTKHHATIQTVHAQQGSVIQVGLEVHVVKVIDLSFDTY
jgi:hypothetical protein